MFEESAYAASQEDLSIQRSFILVHVHVSITTAYILNKMLVPINTTHHLPIYLERSSIQLYTLL